MRLESPVSIHVAFQIIVKEFLTGVYDRFHFVVFLCKFQPVHNTFTQVCCTIWTRFLNIQDRGEVARLQLHMFGIVPELPGRILAWTIIVVCHAHLIIRTSGSLLDFLKTLCKPGTEQSAMQ